MDIFNFIWNSLHSTASFIFHLILFSAPPMILVYTFFNKNTVKNKRIVLYVSFITTIIGPGLAVYLTWVNPQLLDVFYDKLRRYNATEITISFTREPTDTEIQSSLNSIANEFPYLQKKYPRKRVISRYGGGSVRLVGTAKTMPYYWKKEGNQLFLYLSKALSDSDLKTINADINQRFSSHTLQGGHDKKLSKEVKMTLVKTPSARLFYYIQKNPQFFVENSIQLGSIDKRLLVYPKQYFNFPALNKEQDRPTAECNIKFIMDDLYWSTFLQSTTDSILNNKNEIAKSVLKLKDADEGEVKLVLRQLFLGLKFNAEFSNGEQYPASIFLSEKEESHLVITIKKYYDEIFRASDREYQCFNMIKEIPIFNNTFIEGNFLTDFPEKTSIRSFSVENKKFSPFYHKVLELKL